LENAKGSSNLGKKAETTPQNAMTIGPMGAFFVSTVKNQVNFGSLALRPSTRNLYFYYVTL